MRYSVHLSVCGAIFNLAIFDRAGGAVSKDYNINKDMETFIRIIRRLGRDLDPYDLRSTGPSCPSTCLAAGNNSQDVGSRSAGRHRSRRDRHSGNRLALLAAGHSSGLLYVRMMARDLAKSPHVTYREKSGGSTFPTAHRVPEPALTVPLGRSKSIP